MDKYTIFTKTAKGLSETLGKTKALSRESRKILKEVDGKATLGDIFEKLDDISEAKIQVAMTKMLADDFIREFASAAPPVPQASMGDSIFGMTTPAPLENAHSQLTIGDFMRAMESASAKNETGNEGGSLSFKALFDTPSESEQKAHAEEVLHKAQIAREQAEAEQKAKAEEETRRQRVAEEQTRKQADMQARIAAQEKARHEAEEKARHDAEQARLKQAEEKALQEAAEAVRRQEAEQQARQQAEAMARQEAVAIARQKAEAEAKAKQEAEEKARLEAEQQARREAQERARKEAEAHARAEEEVARREAEAKAKREAEEAARLKAEEETIAAAQERARQLAEEQARQDAAKAKQEAEEQAKRAAEEQVRREAEEKARQEAEAQAIAAAQERARQLAEEQAHQEAEEQARRAAEAEAKAKQEAEEAARREAEEQARREAEARAKKEAEEQARQKAWEAVRLAAEAQAKREAEAQAKREAEEQARREAEEQARLKAEEKARKEAEEKARKEAEAQAKREAAEKARQEAEEKARLKAEEKARKQAEEKARKEAEAKAKEEARERARQEAEEQARLKAEERAKKETEEKVRREAEEKAREEAREQARKEAEEKARIAAAEKIKRDAEEEVRREMAEKAKQEAEEKARLEREEKARLKAEEDARKQAEKEARKAEKEAARTSGDRVRIPLFKLLALGAGALVALLVIGIIVLQVMPFNGRLPELQKSASAHFGHPVKIKNIHFSLFPKPTWQLEDVLIGDAGQIGVHRIDAAANLGDLFGGDIGFNTVVLQSPVVSDEGLGWLLFGRAGQDKVGVRQVRATHASLNSKQIILPVFDVQVDIGEDGNWQKIVLDASQEKLHVELQPKGTNVQVEISAESFTPPFGATQSLEKFNASGTANRREFAIKEFKGIVLGGVVSGNALLNWESDWNLSGTLEARQINSSQLAPALVQNGTLDFGMRYTLQAADAKKLFTAARGRGNFNVGNGTLAGIDMAGTLLGQSGNKSSSFNSLTGEYLLTDGKLQLRRVQLGAGLLSASGSADVEPDGQLNGRFSIDLKTASRQVRGNLNLSGTVKEPQVSR